MRAETPLTRRLRHVPVAVVGLLLALILADPWGAVTQARLKGFDFVITRSADTRDPAVAAVLVEIDTASAAHMGRAPWSRARLGDLVARVAEAGPRLIVLDLPLPGADPTSPEQIIAGLDDGPARSALAAVLPFTRSHDAELGTILATAGVVTAYGLTRSQDVESLAGPAALATTFDRDNPLVLVHDYAGALPSAPLARLSPDRLGAQASLADRDDITRRAALLVSVAGSLQPTVLLQTLRLIADADSAHITAVRAGTNALNNKPGRIETVRLNALELPTASDGGLWLARAENAAPSISAAAVFEGRARDLVEGRIAVIGAGPQFGNAVRLAGAPSPVSASLPVVMALNQTLSDTLLTRTPTGLALELGTILAAGMLIGLLFARAPALLAGTVALALIAGCAIGAIEIHRASTELIDPVVPGLALSLVTLAGFSTRLIERFALRRQVRQGLEGKVEAARAARLVRRPGPAGFYGDRRKLTVLTASIRNFHEVTDALIEDPEGLRIIGHEFANWAHALVRRSGGTLDYLSGPRVTAFWNAPDEDMDHAMHACECAMRLIDGLEALNRAIEIAALRRHRTLPPVHVEVAVNTGQSFLGDMGSLERPDYAVVGEVASLAERMRERSRLYGPAVLIGEHTANAVRNLFALLEVDRLEVPGKPMPLRVYALMGNPLVRASPRFRAIEAAQQVFFEAYDRRDWNAARAALQNARNLRGALPTLYDLYEARIDYLERNAPGEDWDGVFRPSAV